METLRGGKRIGAGRKKGLASIKAEEARKYMNERISSELEPIITSQIEMAKGMYYEVIDEEGVKKVYRNLPDPRAATYLLNQLVGKAKETMDMNVTPIFSLRELAERRKNIALEDKAMFPIEEL
jgi:hypothetical protein